MTSWFNSGNHWNLVTFDGQNDLEYILAFNLKKLALFYFALCSSAANLHAEIHLALEGTLKIKELSFSFLFSKKVCFGFQFDLC